jgi:glutamine synthetase
LEKKPLDIKLPSTKVSDYYGKAWCLVKMSCETICQKIFIKSVTDAANAGEPIDRKIAESVATGMKAWALDNGATHYTHWFQPLTDGTAEKHDGFIDYGENGDIVEDFSGKLLAQQEPDASSFPFGRYSSNI